jgi:hypothetical protein
MGGSVALFALRVVAAASVALVAVAVVAMGLADGYSERVRRALAAIARGAKLRAGPGALHGIARSVNGGAGGRLATSTGTQARREDAWRDVGCVVSGSPFVVELPSGEGGEIDSARLALTGFCETPGSPYLTRSADLAHLGHGASTPFWRGLWMEPEVQVGMLAAAVCSVFVAAGRWYARVRSGRRAAGA